jgi:hypothetical protein
VQRQQEQERSRKVHVMDEEELRLLASRDQTVTHLPGNQSSTQGYGSGILKVTDQKSRIRVRIRIRIKRSRFRNTARNSVKNWFQCGSGLVSMRIQIQNQGLMNKNLLFF